MTIRSNKVAVWAGALAFALLAPLAHANFVTNGGFETGDFTGWTLTGSADGVTNSGVASLTPHSGTYNAFFTSNDPADPPGGISQSITTIAGVTYTVDFWLKLDDSAQPNSFQWSWNGELHPLVPVDFPNAFGYTEFSRQEIGAAGSSLLSFSFTNPQSFFELDDVSVVVPEPGTLALMGVAMIGGGVARRRKKLD